MCSTCCILLFRSYPLATALRPRLATRTVIIACRLVANISRAALNVQVHPCLHAFGLGRLQLHESLPGLHLPSRAISWLASRRASGFSKINCQATLRLGAHIASPCHTILPLRSIPRHIRLRRPTFRNPVWRIRTFSQDSSSSSPLAIPLLTPTRRRQCSPRTRIRRLKASSRAMRAIEHRPRASTCRYHRSTCRRYGSKMDSNSHHRLNNSQGNRPWALRCLNRRTVCHITMAINHTRMRRPISR